MHYSFAHIFFVSLLSLMPSLASAHGYLSSPPPRGIQKATTDVDALKAPNKLGLCRGEPAGQITTVASGSPLTLGFTITAPHIGPCTVFLLDEDLSNSQQIAEKDNCAAPGMVGPWTIQLPQGVSGRKVLRWEWEGRQISPEEEYEQCVDLMLTPSDGSSGYVGGGPSVAPPVPPVSGSDYSQNSSPSLAPPVPSSGPSYASTPSYTPTPPTPSPPSYTSAPPTPSPPVSAYPTTSSTSACTSGTYQCLSGPMFEVCSNGAWIQQSCGPSQQCVPEGTSSIVCGLSQ